MLMNTSERAVGVLGSGTMGSGIAITMLLAGHRVRLYDLDEERASQGVRAVEKFLARSVALGKLTGERRDVMLARVDPVAAVEQLGPCDVIVEAIIEDLGAKQRLLTLLDDVCSPSTLFHTNTSTLSVTAIAAGSRHPERVIGTHFCNPAPLMSLVEVVRGRRTGDEQYNETLRFIEQLSKRPVQCRDTPGFIVNFFLVPFENDCIRALEAGMGTIEEIDRAVTLGLRYPMGTFRLLDIVGLDIHRAVSTSLYEQLRDPRFAAPALVDRMISAGQLGRKTGEGFYTYQTEDAMRASA